MTTRTNVQTWERLEWTETARQTSGEWDNEPDKVSWEYKGLPCIIRRNHNGAWCGYVGVSAEHPRHGQGYDDNYDLGVHGGLTYAESCEGDPLAGGVCHVADEGDDHVWWFGFDCGHASDLSPALRDVLGDYGTYRNQEYVMKQTERLADQLLEDLNE